MCSIAIPSELLLGHSPPVYGSLLYSSLMVTTPPIASRSVPPQIRPCLASGSLQLGGLLKGSNDAANNNRKNKKRVVFADDRGRPLTQVRVMSEPSNMPPLWTSAYIASLARGEVFRNLDGSLTILQQSQQQTQQAQNNNKPKETLNGERLLLAEASPWEASFSQPASDYLAFRAKLDRSSVSLENVIVRESEHCLVGTVKVKNIAYDKEVTIRVTSDSWASHEDVECNFVEQPGLTVSQAAVRSLYDTFRFRLTLPQTQSKSSSSSPLSSPTGTNKTSHQIEFCVRYRSGGEEFWDNNDGANYIVKKKRQVTLEEQVAELLSACCGPSAAHNGFLQMGTMRRAKQDAQQLVHPVDDATKMHLRTWSEFASWQHLENDGPYW
ncbi:hypothetical protein QAD02_022074 [Eretmocerus hayati]|uniref:Uncharacterized protein n=1 Tax=Eretmocerus hayati TaxID=131215 RepID=A0ACC2PWU4_9HYME|nr:hypothetical protein QAD02_022074 [Eretmocerus hayati]